MGKKLVKTAKQQFEERLCELELWETWVKQGYCGRVGVETDDAIYILVHEDKQDKFSEIKSPKFEQLIKNDSFRSAMMAQMYDWGAEDSTIANMVDFLFWSGNPEKNQAFPVDVYFCLDGVETEYKDFEDLYEEVLTAKEQWKRDSKDAKSTMVKDRTGYRIVQREECIEVYVDKDGKEFFKDTIPSLENLRKDAEFVTRYLSYMNANRANFMNHALSWLSDGKFTMNEYGLLDIYKVCVDHCNTTYRYVDGEESKPIVKQDFKEEMDELRANMVAHIEQLCEQGLKLNVEVLCMNYTLTWTDRSYVICEDVEDCWFAKDDSGKWMFYRKDRDGEWDSKIEYFTIETLKDFIEALQ